MRRISKIAIAILLGLAIGACKIQSVVHDPDKAVSDTNEFLRALYVIREYDKALTLADPQLRKSLSADDLKHLVEGMEQQQGSLKELRADSYLMTSGETMELFYVAACERGNLYHRLVLKGDASSGYRVSGVWYSVDPYPSQPLRREFSEKFVIQ
jgi:hypothetical protein